MTEERLDPAESTNKAVEIVKLLIGFEFPKDHSEYEKYSEKLELLQKHLANLWQDDRTGKVMVECLHTLYDRICVLHPTPISLAAWSILDLVDVNKIGEIVKGILNDPVTNEDAKVQNALMAIVEGLYQYGDRAPRLLDWVCAIVQDLQARKSYDILAAVAECKIENLRLGVLMPSSRSLVYPIFRHFLCAFRTPTVFYKIIDKVPETIIALEKGYDDEETRLCLNNFSQLLRILLVTYPPEPYMEEKYNTIREMLARLPNDDTEREVVLWNLGETRSLSDWTVQPFLSDYDYASETPYKGLINQGNTCFMNSVLQILYMTTRFRHEILRRDIDPTERAALDLQQLFAFMQESNRSVLVPNGVMDSTLPPTFRRGHQQDSSEYLIYLLDTLHENENKIIRRRRQRASPLRNSTDKKIDGNGDFEGGATSFKQSNAAEPENTVVERLFGGVTMSTTVCSFCERSFPKNDSFRDLHLSLPDDYKSCDLQELINVSLQPEELCSDNMYDCANCGTKRNATRKQTIIKAPQHLILTLKLFRFDAVRKQRLKLHSRLKNAKTIQLPVYNSSQLQTKAVMYDVKGVVLHSGASLDGGHYFSSACDQSGKWYIFNDSMVSVAKSEWSWGGGTPYILVLRQSELGDPPKGALPASLQLLVNMDNQKYLAERRYHQRLADKKRDYDDDWDDTPPSNGSFAGGSGPSLVC